MDTPVMHAQAATKQSDIKPIRTGAEYIESLRNRKLKVYLFGELVDEPVDHPIIRPSINAVAETYDLAVRNPELATAAFIVHRGAREPVSPHRPEPGRPGDAEQDAAPARPAHRHLLPALRGHGCAQLAALGDLRDGREVRHGVPPTLHRVRRHGAAGQLRHRRRHDRREGRPQQGAQRAGRPRPVRARHRPHGQGHHHQGCQSTPDRLPELALADRHADDAARRPPTRTTRSSARCPSTRRASPTSTAASPATRGARTRAASTPATPASPARKR